MTTIYDVALASGFSPATVSKAFNNYPGVSANTVEIIMKTAKKMGYRPNITARSLTTKKNWLVGMLFSDELATGIRHPHFSEICASAQIRLSEAGYDVVFINNSLGGGKHSYLEHCHYRGVEGVFMAASAEFGQAVQCVVDSNLNLVSVESLYPNRYSVISENYNGAKRAMEFLYSLGHRKIAYISGPMYTLSAPERYKGYCDFLSEKGLKHYQKIVVEASDYSVTAGIDASLKLLSTAKGEFTALFADYDDLAYAAISCLKESGLSVPGDVSVIGFDDLALSEISGLTTIRQDRNKIGSLAADILIAQMQNLPIEYDFDTRVPTSLVVRSSCRNIL